MKVEDIMTGHAISIGAEESVETAARQLKRWNLGALPVCDGEGRLRGMVTDRDIVLRCVSLGDDPHNTKVSEIMSRNICTVRRDQPLAEATAAMCREQVRRLPVTEEGRLVGMLSLCDLARQNQCIQMSAQTLGVVSDNIRRPSDRS